jgi:hypothetical protein
MSFAPCNFFLKIWRSIGTPTPKVGAHLGMCGFILSHPLTLLGAWNVTPRLHFWLAPLQAFTLVASPRLKLWHSPFLLIFLLVGWHCVINWWHLPLGGHGYCWPHLSRLGLSSCFISWGSRNDDSSGKGRTLPWLALDRHLFSPCHKFFWVFTSISIWFFPSMC